MAWGKPQNNNHACLGMQDCAREALEAVNLLPKVGFTQNNHNPRKRKNVFVNACDVSDLLEYSYADLLMVSEHNPEASCEESLLEIGDAIRSTPEWILGLAALPLSLRKVPDPKDPECVRYCATTDSCCVHVRLRCYCHQACAALCLRGFLPRCSSPVVRSYQLSQTSD